ALFCYDYCLTFRREVRLVSRHGASTSSILLYAVRYSAFFSTIFVILDLLPWKGISDRVLFSGLRVYALWDRNLRILALVLLLGLVNPAISIVRVFRLCSVSHQSHIDDYIIVHVRTDGAHLL
ncbi:hypothetical protein BV20DRAFT_951428, partial [Pilatotrama ljubarskyi]